MYCSNCGKQIPANANFCSNCGYKVSSGETIGNPMVHATSANVYQAPDEMHADFEFEVQSRNGATVSVLRKITNIRNNVIKIPAKDGQGNPVVEIASTTNRGVCDAYIEYLVIPDSVTCIGKKAFAYNHLNHITIPNSVTSIGDDAFYDCNIPELKLPDTIKSIGRTAFCASKITNINIPGSVTFCGDTILSTCSNLKNVTIGDGFKRIEDRMFYYNYSLESITLPSTLEYISANAFEQCKVQKVHFRGTQAQWKALTASSHYSTRAQWQALMTDLRYGTLMCFDNNDNANANNTASEKDKLLLFAKKSCPNCKMASVFLDKADLVFQTVYIEDSPEDFAHYNVKQTPTLVIIHPDGQSSAIQNVSNIRQYIADGTIPPQESTTPTAIRTESAPPANKTPQNQTIQSPTINSDQTSDKTVKLFVRHGSPNCDEACKELNKAGIPYEKLEFSNNIALAKKHAIMNVPTLLVYTASGTEIYVSVDGILENYINKGEANTTEYLLLRTKIQERRNQREEEYRINHMLCRHCGGEFKGLFFKKCKDCGCRKDY